MRTYGRYEIFSYGTNIHKMLNGMFVGDRIDDDLDFLEYLRSIEDDDMLDKEFSDIFLIFDMDPQDPKYDPERLSEAAEYFRDSADNGKLYINYPMMESFKHIGNLDDLSYLEVKVDGKGIRRYKEIAAKEGCSQLSDISKIDEVTMMKVIVLNLRKANKVLNGDNGIPDHVIYDRITQSAILSRELEMFSITGELPVLNTSVFNAIDYNSEHFYRKVRELQIADDSDGQNKMDTD